MFKKIKLILKNGQINMKGYWIALYKKIDSVDNLKNYAAKVTPVIKSYGGKPLVRGGKYQRLEGDDF